MNAHALKASSLDDKLGRYSFSMDQQIVLTCDIEPGDLCSIADRGIDRLEQELTSYLEKGQRP